MQREHFLLVPWHLHGCKGNTFQLCRDLCADVFVQHKLLCSALCALCSLCALLCCPALHHHGPARQRLLRIKVRHHDAPHREPPPARLLFSKVKRSQAIPSLARRSRPAQYHRLEAHVPDAHHSLSLDIRLPLDKAPWRLHQWQIEKPSNPQFPNSKTNQHPHPAIGRKPGDAARPLAPGPCPGSFRASFLPRQRGPEPSGPTTKCLPCLLLSCSGGWLAGWLAGGRAAGRALGCDASRHPDPDRSGMNEVSWPCCTLAPGCKLQLIYRRTAGGCLVESAERKSGRTLSHWTANVGDAAGSAGWLKLFNLREAPVHYLAATAAQLSWTRGLPPDSCDLSYGVSVLAKDMIPFLSLPPLCSLPESRRITAAPIPGNNTAVTVLPLSSPPPRNVSTKTLVSVWDGREPPQSPAKSASFSPGLLHTLILK